MVLCRVHGGKLQLARGRDLSLELCRFFLIQRFQRHSYPTGNPYASPKIISSADCPASVGANFRWLFNHDTLNIDWIIKQSDTVVSMIHKKETSKFFAPKTICVSLPQLVRDIYLFDAGVVVVDDIKNRKVFFGSSTESILKPLFIHWSQSGYLRTFGNRA